MKVLFAQTIQAHLQACLAKLLPLMLLGMLLSMSVPTIAQVTVSLSYQEKNSLTTLKSGETYTMQLNYSVSSTTGNATGVQAVIDFPARPDA